MKSLLISALLHIAVIGAIWVASRPVVVTEPPIPIEPLDFELVEASQVAVATPLAPAEPKPENPIPPVTVADPVIAAPPAAIASVVTPPVVALPRVAVPEIAPPVEELPEVATSSEIEQPRVVTAPQAVNRISPKYPRSARRHHHEGLVTVEFSVNASGSVGSARVVVSSGHDDLDDAALAAVRQASFKPATEDGVVITATMQLTFDFRLKQ